MVKPEWKPMDHAQLVYAEEVAARLWARGMPGSANVIRELIAEIRCHIDAKSESLGLPDVELACSDPAAATARRADSSCADPA